MLLLLYTIRGSFLWIKELEKLSFLHSLGEGLSTPTIFHRAIFEKGFCFYM
jgi:hypothetical protein